MPGKIPKLKVGNTRQCIKIILDLCVNLVKYTSVNTAQKMKFSIKVARVVNLKLAFTEWSFYDLIILIKLYKIRYLNLDKALLFPRNQIFCLKNWKLWRASTTIKFNIFCWKFCTRFLLNNAYKKVFRIFFILFRSQVINKNVKDECVETRSFLFLQITQDLNKIQKIPNTLL